jgi:hypothetical protein
MTMAYSPPNGQSQWGHASPYPGAQTPGNNGGVNLAKGHVPVTVTLTIAGAFAAAAFSLGIWWNRQQTAIESMQTDVAQLKTDVGTLNGKVDKIGSSIEKVLAREPWSASVATRK